MPRKKKPQTPSRAFIERTYRRLVRSALSAERVVVRETDLTIYSDSDVPLADAAREAVMTHRGYIENYIRSHPGFVCSLAPLKEDHLAPAIIRDMLGAGRSAGVGPMAAVAGAVAEKVGRHLLTRTPQVIVENGGDIFLCTSSPPTVGVFAGPSPLSMKIGIRLTSTGRPTAVCTSSASIGHSLSLGRADAACVIGESCALADAVATALGNRVTGNRQIQPAIDWAARIPGVAGVLVIAGENMGAWGALEVVPI